MNLRQQCCHIIIHSPEHCEAVQKRLFELGYRWRGGGTRVAYQDAASLSLNYQEGEENIVSFNADKEKRPRRSHTIVTLDDLYSDKFTVPKSVTIALNSEYKATVEPDGITVGCQTFPLSVIDELVKARAEVLS